MAGMDFSLARNWNAVQIGLEFNSDIKCAQQGELLGQ